MEYKLSTLSVSILRAVLTTLSIFFIYLAFVEPWFNPLRNLPGPPSKRAIQGPTRSSSISPQVQEAFVKQYGRNVMIRGILPVHQRLFTLDPVTLSHKPWHSRWLIIGLTGCGMLAVEGQVHKRQRRVAIPAFSVQNMRALVLLVFVKGNDHDTSEKAMNGAKLDVCHWVSRATFDVIGSAGFDYQFNAIQDETNELFSAYEEMFEIGVSQQEGSLRSLVALHFPIINTLFPDKAALTVRRCQEVIRHVAGQLVQEKKHKTAEAERSGSIYQGKDLLTLLFNSNGAADLPPEQRISDEDILHNINTFMFTSSNTSSLAITWMLHLLANVPVRTRMPDGSVQEVMSIRVPKGALIHVPMEGFNLDREVWETDGWAFNPDRWDNLPEAMKSQPGLYNNTLTFSAGPRSCIGMHFSVIEMKTFLFILLTSFTFAESDEQVGKANVVLTRLYVVGKHLEGSKCPLLMTPYIRESAH
ncbi:cytochrome P450 [Laetiporus sulphureus 93-53]|uniref:Cytochrome P450 n=1 Tax=Laetiporus sulphureus 93-53 TaxID=1314785 RepID=A0A165FEL0_9APHY|nr:cytochrome P450 [Laetiporus sulphureus 93-53]KZT08852.1 cytochrome P450 [Laetiporus sulphureus 93-53]